MTNWMAILVVLAAFGQTPTDDEPRDAGAEVATKSADGLWPSEKILGLLLARVSDQMTERYGLSEARQEEVREAFVDRWSSYLNENRDKLQPLANEFLEMRLGLTPPDKDRVREWAGRTGPIFDEIKRHVRESRDAVGKALDAGQRAKFVAESMAMEVGLQFAEMKLAQYEAGRFDDVDFWQPHGMDREARKKIRKDRRQRRRAAVAEIRKNQPPIDQIEAELTAWEAFTDDFMRIYDLDDGQRNAALSCLSELSERAKAHSDRYREDIARLEKRIAAGTASGKELDDIKEQLVSLYGPIDDMFGELKNRLGRLPTSEQRARVAEVQGGGG
jgi:hypothetical protein